MRPRDNPFRTELTDALPYHPQDTTWEALLARLRRLDYRAAIVGPHGSGKTTLLEELARRLEDQGLKTIRLRVDERRPLRVLADLRAAQEAIGPDAVVLLDSAELLGRLGWALLKARTRRARGLVATTHTPGHLPTLVRCSTNPLLLRQLLCELTPERAAKLAPVADRLFRACGGNIRDVFRALYLALANGDPAATQWAKEV